MKKKILSIILTFLLVVTVLNIGQIQATRVKDSVDLQIVTVPYEIWINKNETAETTVLGQTILETKNFDESGKTSQAVVAAPVNSDSGFNFNSEFYLDQAFKKMIWIVTVELWSALKKPAENSIATLANTKKPSDYSYVDLVVELGDYIDYTDPSGVIQNAYFDAPTWRPIFVFDSNYNVLDDFRTNPTVYTPGVTKKSFDIHTNGSKTIIVRVVPIDKAMTTEEKQTPLKFGVDNKTTFKISKEKSNELAEKRRSMTEQEIMDEKRALDKVISSKNKLTDAEKKLINKYNAYATGEIRGNLIASQYGVDIPVAVDGKVLAAGIAVTYKNPSVAFLKNDTTDVDTTDVREDLLDRVYVDYNGAIPNDTLVNESVPTNPTRDGYEFVGWSTTNNSATADFDPTTAVITNDTTVYAVWKKAVSVRFDKNAGASEIIHTAMLYAGETIDSNTGAGSTMPANPVHVDTTKIFKEWNMDANGNGQVFTSTTPVDNDTVVYAIYSEKYNVSYKFVSDDASELPEEIKNQLPEKSQVDKGANVTPIKSTFDEVVGYEFKGWKTPQFDNVASNVEFEGEWVKKALDLEYKFVSTDQKKQAALDVTVVNKLPATSKIKIGDAYNHATTFDDVIEADPAHDGKWVFDKWSITSPIVVKEDIQNNQKVVVTGTWNFVPNQYDVEYKFTSVTTGKDLPDAIKNYNGSTKVLNGATVDAGVAKVPTFNDDENDGVWNFKAWDQTQKTVAKANVVFNGTYEFTPNQYDVEYKFVSGTQDKALPASIQGYVDTVKAVNKDVITAKAAPIQTVNDDVNDGVWNFKAWDQTQKTVAKANVVFNGTYEFTPNQYDVAVNFESAVATDKALPTPLQTAVLKKLTFNQIYDLDAIELRVIDVDNNGVWVFKNVDTDAEVIKASDTQYQVKQNKKTNSYVTFKYEFVENKYNVTYVFNVKDNAKSLPEALAKRLENKNKVDLPSGTEVKTEGIDTTEYKDTALNGKWVFKGWNKEVHEIQKSDFEFVGEWEFIPEYTVTYAVVSVSTEALPQEILDRKLPEVVKGKVAGDAVELPTNYDTIELDLANGKWQFVEWTKSIDVIKDANAVVTGTWKFVSKIKPNPSVKPEDPSSTPNQSEIEDKKNKKDIKLTPEIKEIKDETIKNQIEKTEKTKPSVDTSDSSNAIMWVFGLLISLFVILKLRKEIREK